MKKLITLILIIGIMPLCRAQYKPVSQGSAVKFTIKNLGFNVDGNFSGLDGNINFDTQNPAASSFDVTINAASINTDNSLRDEHLKGDGFFDIKNYPRIRLASSQISGNNGNYLFKGQVTIKGKSQPLSFPFTASALADGLAFKGSFKLKRRDFGVGGISTVSDELEVSLNVIAKKSII